MIPVSSASILIEYSFEGFSFKTLNSLHDQYAVYVLNPRSERGLSGVPCLFSILASSYEKLIMNFPYPFHWWNGRTRMQDKLLLCLWSLDETCSAGLENSFSFEK